ncbi:MAG: hypothetical protein C0499_02620 [Zymomonas sp.]|nr:hypothetical protein [Zymomonas sp.]
MTSAALTTAGSTKLPAPLAQRLVGALPELTAILGDDASARRTLQESIVAIQRNPKLLEADPDSFMLAVSTVAQWGLSIGTTAHLVPFHNTRQGKTLVTPMADYTGLIALVVATKAAASVEARAVYRDERFEVSYGTNAGITHDPDFGKRSNPANLTHVYAISRDHFGRPKQFVVLTRAEVEQRRAVSRAKDGDAWTKWYERMCCKTAVRALCKMLPQNPRLAAALDGDDTSARVPPVDLAALAQGELALPALAASESLDESTGEIIGEAIEALDLEEVSAVPTLADALAYILPGKGTSWGGFGGKPLGLCRNTVLRKAAEWAREQMQKEGGFANAAQLAMNCDAVLAARVAGTHQEPEKVAA